MGTNWQLIRKVLNSAVDACEAVENAGVTEFDRGATFEVAGVTSGTMWDYLQSGWIAPENLRYAIIRARHELGEDKPYTNELSRIIEEAGRLSAELVGAEDTRTRVQNVGAPFENDASIEEMTESLCDWYQRVMMPSVSRIMDQKNNGGGET